MVISEVAMAGDDLAADGAVLLARWQTGAEKVRGTGRATYMRLMYWSMQLLQNLWRQAPEDLGSQ